MSNLFARLFAFFFPIVKGAVLQVAADELGKLAYPNRPSRLRSHTPYTRYNELRSYAEQDVRATQDLFFDKGHEPDANTAKKYTAGDVLMVAFDLRGRSTDDIQRWLETQMPVTGDYRSTVYGDINLDAWWIADDDAPGDCDSAVFVKKGRQSEARETLNEFGLAN